MTFFFFFFRFKLSRKKIMLKKGSVKSKRQMYLLENPFSDQAILSLKPSGLSTSHSPANKCQTPWFGSQRPCPSGLRWFFGLCFLMPRFCVLFCNKIRLFIFLEEPSFPLFAHLCLFYPKRFFSFFPLLKKSIPSISPSSNTASSRELSWIRFAFTPLDTTSLSLL